MTRMDCMYITTDIEFDASCSCTWLKVNHQGECTVEIALFTIVIMLAQPLFDKKQAKLYLSGIIITGGS